MAHHLEPHKDDAVRWFAKNERICVGWGTIGDIASHNYQSSQDIQDAIRHQYLLGNHPYNNFKSSGDSLWNLYGEMEPGDLVIVKGAHLWTVMKIDGDYQFRSDLSQTSFPDYFHQRRAVAQSRINPQKLWGLSGGMAKDGGSIYRALVRCAHTVEAS